MNRTIGTAILALALGLGAPAMAQDDERMLNTRTTLEQYGYDLDPTLLTDDQLTRFEELSASGSTANEIEARQRIDEILVMDAGTSTFVSEEMRAMFDNPTELEANARQLLARAGATDVDVSTLSFEQLAQLWFINEHGTDYSDADLTSRVQAVLN
jgi:hypothetical protein